MMQIIDDLREYILKSEMRLNIYPAIICISLTLISYSPSSACNVCHSKNPKMVKMHEALGFKDCFNCHGPGKKASSLDQPTRMSSDPLCVGCHKK
jgi:predicted CXXCH cytochrome family protein